VILENKLVLLQNEAIESALEMDKGTHNLLHKINFDICSTI